MTQPAKSHLLNVLRSPATYPLTVFWAIAMVVVPMVVAAWLSLNTGLILLSAAALILIVVSYMVPLRTEVAEMHALVDDLVTDADEGVDHDQ